MPKSACRSGADGKQFAFINTIANGIELWIGDTSTSKIRKLIGATINAPMVSPTNGRTTEHSVQLVRTNRGKSSRNPSYLWAQCTETSGKRQSCADVRTFFKSTTTGAVGILHHIAAGLHRCRDRQSGSREQSRRCFSLSMYRRMKVHLVSMVHRPFTYTRPASAFPRSTEIWDAAESLQRCGSPLRKHAAGWRSSADPRKSAWQPKEPSSLVWVEALDNGIPIFIAEIRDRIVLLKSPSLGRKPNCSKRSTGFPG
jgi:hypothetical protein